MPTLQNIEVNKLIYRHSGIRMNVNLYFFFSVNELQHTPINNKNALTKLHRRKEKKVKKKKERKEIITVHMSLHLNDSHYIIQY